MEEEAVSPAVQHFWRLFVNRADTYCLQQPGGRYQRVRRGLREEDIEAHLAGTLTLALDSLGVDGMTRWAVWDSDADDGLLILAQVQHVCTGWGLVTWLEQSRRGGHLWLPCATPQPAAAVRRLAQAACEAVGVTMEIYPNRDAPSRGAGVTQPVRLPLGVHQASGRRYPFVDALGRSLHRPEPVHMLAWLLGQPVNHTGQVQGALHTVGDIPRVAAGELAWGQAPPAPRVPAPSSSSHAVRHVPKKGGAKWGVIAWVNRQPLPSLIAKTRPDVALRATYVAFQGWCPFHNDSEGEGAAPSLYVWCDPDYGWHWRCYSTHCGASQGKAKDPFDWLVWCCGGIWRKALAWGLQLEEEADKQGGEST